MRHPLSSGNNPGAASSVHPCLKVEHGKSHSLEGEGGVAGHEAHPRVLDLARHRRLIPELRVARTLVICRVPKFTILPISHASSWQQPTRNVDGVAVVRGAVYLRVVGAADVEEVWPESAEGRLGDVGEEADGEGREQEEEVRPQGRGQYGGHTPRLRIIALMPTKRLHPGLDPA